MALSSRSVSVVVLCVALAAAAGCSYEIPKGVVSGTVTFDKQPLKEGIIRFVPVDGKAPPADGPISNGKFEVQVPVGDKKVEITAPRVVGKLKMYDTPGSPEADQVVELLPPQYNIHSELTMTVERGPQVKQFDLKSK